MGNRADVVVLVSGGLDSAVCLARAIADGLTPAALTIRYGQRHEAEIAAAGRVVRSMSIPPERHIIVSLDLRAIGGSALTADIDVPKDRAANDMAAAVPATYVPARNLTFLSIAAAYAETLGARVISIGVNAVDYSGYPDCREEFIRAFEAAAALGTRAGTQDGRPISVLTPLARLAKPEIIRMGHELGVDFALTHSCYDPAAAGGEAQACGRCDACLIRAAGFRSAGLIDPTRYAAAGSARPQRV